MRAGTAHKSRRARGRKKLEGVLTLLERVELIRQAVGAQPEYLFKNALTQESAYESLLLKNRREMHLRVAGAYEELYAGRLDEIAALLAEHYSRAGDDAKTAEYSLQAAQAAMRLYAYPEARGHLSNALDALVRLPDSQEHRRERVDAIFWYIEVAWGAFVPDEVLGLVLEAEKLAQSLRNPDGTTGDPRRLAQSHTRLTGLYLARGKYLEANRYARQGLAEASGLTDRLLTATPAAQLGIVLVAQGYFTEAVPYLEQAVSLTEETTNKWEWFGSLGTLGAALAMGGQVEEGMAEVQRALIPVEESQNGFGITQTRAFLLVTCLEQGDMTRLLTESERTVKVAVKSDMALHAAVALGFKALAQSRLGQAQDAIETTAAARAMGARVGGQMMMSDWLDAIEAEIALNAGKFEDAMRLAAEAVTVSQSCDGIFAEGWAHRVWGQAGAKVGTQDEQVEGHFARSLELFEQGGAVLEAARTHLAWGNMLKARGKAEAAREHFEKAGAQEGKL